MCWFYCGVGLTWFCEQFPPSSLSSPYPCQPYRCFYCAMPYKVIAKYETFQQDIRWSIMNIFWLSMLPMVVDITLRTPSSPKHIFLLRIVFLSHSYNTSYQVHRIVVQCNIPGGLAGKCGRRGSGLGRGGGEERHLREDHQLFQAGI